MQMPTGWYLSVWICWIYLLIVAASIELHTLPPEQASTVRRLVTRVPRSHTLTTLIARSAPSATPIRRFSTHEPDHDAHVHWTKTDNIIPPNKLKIARAAPEATSTPAGQGPDREPSTAAEIAIALFRASNLNDTTSRLTRKIEESSKSTSQDSCTATSSASRSAATRTPIDRDINCYKVRQNFHDDTWFEVDQLQNFTSALAKLPSLVITNDEPFDGPAPRIYGIRAVSGDCFYFIHDRATDIIAQVCLANGTDENGLLGTKFQAQAAALPPIESIVENLSRLHKQLAIDGHNCPYKNRVAIYCPEKPWGLRVNKSSVAWTDDKGRRNEVNMRVQGFGQLFKESYLSIGVTEGTNTTKLDDPWAVKDAIVTVTPPDSSSDEWRQQCSKVAKNQTTLIAFTTGLKWLVEDILDKTNDFFSQTEPDQCLRHFCGSRSGLKVSICGFKEFGRYMMTETDTAVVINRFLQGLLAQHEKHGAAYRAQKDYLPSYPLADLECALNLPSLNPSLEQPGLLGGTTISIKVDRDNAIPGQSEPSARTLKISSGQCTQWEGHCSVQVGDTTNGPPLSGIEAARQGIGSASLLAVYSKPDTDRCQQHICEPRSGTQISICSDPIRKNLILDLNVRLSDVNQKIALLQDLFYSGTSDLSPTCDWDTSQVLGDQTAGYHGRIGQWTFDRTNGVKVPPEYWLMIRKGVCNGFSSTPQAAAL
ncbi:hypothetical protein TWF696_001606 [Orbilia brochopaga]|uniref:Uncharacterized protein n=1 Tax=Orbilia brochopaga TaxID=3140254 RepID=A0AAV9U965_9PEZI